VPDTQNIELLVDGKKKPLSGQSNNNMRYKWIDRWIDEWIDEWTDRGIDE